MGSTLFAVLARSSYSRERAISRNGKGESRVSPRLEKSARGYFDNFFFFFFPRFASIDLFARTEEKWFSARVHAHRPGQTFVEL